MQHFVRQNKYTPKRNSLRTIIPGPRPFYILSGHAFVGLLINKRANHLKPILLLSLLGAEVAAILDCVVVPYDGDVILCD